MLPHEITRVGLEARDLNAKDRITLQSRVNVMYINGESEEKILAYVSAFKREFRLDLNATEGMGPRFVNYLARAGWTITLIALVVHYAER